MRDKTRMVFTEKTISFLASCKKDSVWGPIRNYEEFDNIVPIIDTDYLCRRAENVAKNSEIRGVTYRLTSGTSSGTPSMLVSSVKVNDAKRAYFIELCHTLGRYLFEPGDVVANLIDAIVSEHYEVYNRILSLVGNTFLPIGAIAYYNESTKKNILELMSKTQVNTLIVAPAIALLILKLAREYHVSLNIKKIIFIGSPFPQKQRAYVEKCWPEVRFFGLYGQTETAVLGFNTPKCFPNNYHIFDNWFFLETKENNEIIVTSMLDSEYPVIRCKVGDSGEISNSTSCPCGATLPVLTLQGRVDKKFKFGRMIGVTSLKNAIQKTLGYDVTMQIQLDIDEQCWERLNIVLSLSEIELQKHRDNIINSLLEIANVEYAIKYRKSCVINLLDERYFMLNYRGKVMEICDSRGE